MKFGGASLLNPDAIRNVGRIIRDHLPGPSAIVVSAMAKTTNALDELARLAADTRQQEAKAQMARIKGFHHQAIQALFEGELRTDVQHQVDAIFRDLERVIQGILLLEDFPKRFSDYILSFGELLSSTILFNHLKATGLPIVWIDARELIRTDSEYNAANVLWSQTEENIRRLVGRTLEGGELVITQGFIGANSEGYTTTLGREGSDYTAAILAYALRAGKVTIWKDVPGVMTGDPRKYSEATLIQALSYEMAVEMTFYGASVIHPKTIKPLQNLNIPLRVRSFNDPAAEGTTVSSAEDLPPEYSPPEIRLVQTDSALIRIRPRDFSFMDHRRMREVFALCVRAGVDIRLLQTTAISLELVAKNEPEALMAVMALLEEQFVAELLAPVRLTTFLNRQTPVDQEERADRALLFQADQGRIHLVEPWQPTDNPLG